MHKTRSNLNLNVIILIKYQYIISKFQKALQRVMRLWNEA